MHAKANAGKHGEMSSDFKDVEKNNKRFKKNKTDHSNHPKKNPLLTDRGQGTNCVPKEKGMPLERSLSKSMEKSPLRPCSKNTQQANPRRKLNTTPIKAQKKGGNTERKKSPQDASKSRSASASRKNTAKMGQRECSELSPLNDTKRQLFEKGKKGKVSPIKVQASPTKGTKRRQKQKKKKGKDKNIAAESLKEEPLPIHPSPQQDIQAQFCKNKPRRDIPQIRTQFSARKTSNIDDSLLNRLQINNPKSNKDYCFIQSCFVRSVEEEARLQGCRKERLDSSAQESKKRLGQSMRMQSFRKEQEQKWSGMLEQIKSLKNQPQIAQKIDHLIMQITENYNRLKIRSDIQELKEAQERQETKGDEQEGMEVEGGAERTYSIIDQNENAWVQREEARGEQPRSNIISLDDFFHSSERRGFMNLKRDLFEVQTQPVRPAILVSTQQSPIKEEGKEQAVHHQTNQERKPPIREVKEMQTQKCPSREKINSIPAQGQVAGKGNPFLPNNTENIEQVVQYIESSLITEFCSRMMGNERLLHCLLATYQTCSHPIPQRVQGFSHLRQPSCNDYAQHLLQRLLDYLFANYHEYTLRQLSFYYQCKPIEILRYVRSSHMQEEQQEASYQIENEKEIEIPFFNLGRIEEFELFQLGNSAYLPNYFGFNHCVYDAFNDIVDRLRPYGSRGKSIFTLQLAHPLRNQQEVRNQVCFKFHEILQGQGDWQWLRDQLVHGEEGNFQIIYFVSLQVMESVYNEAVLELWRISHPRGYFQS